MALPASDDFNRANESPLGGNWTAPDGVSDSKFLLVSNHLEGQAGATIQLMYWNADTFSADQYAQATLGGAALGSNYGGVAVRIQASGQSCYLFWDATGTYQIEKVVGGSRTTLATCSGTPTAGDVLKLSVSGDTLTASVNGTTVGTASGGAAFSSGQAGLCGYGSIGNYTLDLFSADNVGGGGGGGARLSLLATLGCG